MDMTEHDRPVVPILVAVGSLRYSKETWPRDGLDQERVEMFTHLLIEGGEVPPIEVIRRPDGTNLIADGVHRGHGAQAAGKKEIEVVIISPEPGESPEASAFRRHIETATKTALPLTTGERRKAARRLLRERPEMSNRAVARLLGVSHDSVNRWAKELDDSSTGSENGSGSAGFIPTTEQVARRLASDLARLSDTRWFGEALTPNRIGKHLAYALDDALGEFALRDAERLSGWLTTAIQLLREGLA